MEVLPIGPSFSRAFLMKYSASPEVGRIGVLTSQRVNRGLKRLNTLPESHIQTLIEPEFEPSASWLYWPHQLVLLVSIDAAPSILHLLEGPKALHFSLTPGKGLFSLMCSQARCPAGDPPLWHYLFVKRPSGVLVLACCGPWGLRVKFWGILGARRHHNSSLKWAMMGVLTWEIRQHYGWGLPETPHCHGRHSGFKPLPTHHGAPISLSSAKECQASRATLQGNWQERGAVCKHTGQWATTCQLQASFWPPASGPRPFPAPLRTPAHFTTWTQIRVKVRGSISMNVDI